MTATTLFSAIEALVTHRSLKRRETYSPLGRASTEEKGATFGKVTGIEEAIAAHAANVALKRHLEEILFVTPVVDDREMGGSGRVEVGSVVAVESGEYGKDIYGIEAPAENGLRISSASPLGMALLGGEKGKSIVVQGTEYEVTDIRSAGDHLGILSRVESIERQTIKRAEETLAGSAARFAAEQFAVEKKLAVSELIDWCRLIKFIHESYGIRSDDEAALLKVETRLLGEDHFPVESIEPSLRHIMERLT